MYGETFKSALYGAFQPADEECDPSFLVRLLEYFPTDKVDVVVLMTNTFMIWRKQ